MEKLEMPEKDVPDIKDRLLQIIEEGDATVILSSEYTESLNELIKCELIAIENEKLQLTEKGRQAKLVGVKVLVEQNPPTREELKKIKFPPQKVAAEMSNRSFLIILFFFFISLMAIVAIILL